MVGAADAMLKAADVQQHTKPLAQVYVRQLSEVQ